MTSFPEIGYVFTFIKQAQGLFCERIIGQGLSGKYQTEQGSFQKDQGQYSPRTVPSYNVLGLAKMSSEEGQKHIYAQEHQLYYYYNDFKGHLEKNHTQ